MTAAEDAAARIAALPPKKRRGMARAVVRCEWNRCRVATVYRVPEGYVLVSDSDTSMQAVDELPRDLWPFASEGGMPWRPHEPILLETLDRHTPGVTWRGQQPALDVGCKCLRGSARLIDLTKLRALAASAGPTHIRMDDPRVAVG